MLEWHKPITVTMDELYWQCDFTDPFNVRTVKSIEESYATKDFSEARYYMGENFLQASERAL